MGPIARGKFPHLIEDLLQNPSAYSVFQALHLIENNLGGVSGDDTDLQGAITLAPAAEVTFPPGEIRHCRVDERGRYRLELNFMGLFGVDSSLPTFFNDITTFDTQSGLELRGFLELFNQRLYHLIYSAWKKMNLHGSGDARTSLYCRYLDALYGGSDICEDLGRFDYAGLLANRIKNGPSLVGMLQDFLDCPVSIRENIPCWIKLEETVPLGGRIVLGDTAMLGNRLMDVNSKILLKIGPLPADIAVSLLPGRPSSIELARLIREYLDPTIRYDIKMMVKPEAGHESALVEDQPILSWTACLGRAGRDAINNVLLTGDTLDRQLN